MFKIQYKIAYIIGAFTLIASLFMGSLMITAMDSSFYHNEHIKYDTPTYSELTIDQLDDAMRLILDYIVDDIDTLDFQMYHQKTGEKFELFNEKEKLHMIDVKVLYQRALIVTVILWVLTIIISAYLFINRKKAAFVGFTYYINRVSIVISAIVLLLLFIAITNFDFFWTNFHHLVFSNDLWLLNPLTDRLITIVYAEIFFDLVLSIAVRFSILFIGLNGICFWYQRRPNSEIDRKLS